MRLAIKGMMTGPDGVRPAHVAARTVEAIRAGEFWIIPNGGEAGDPTRVGDAIAACGRQGRPPGSGP